MRVFPPSTVIHPHQYFVGSSNLAVFNAVSGQTADFSFAPSGLSSSGETVTLVDAAGATVESLTYAAAAPWPSLPNGLGPSLELTDPFASPADGANWSVSATSVGTPHAQNSSFGPPPPSIANVAASPARPLPTDDVTVQAKLPKGITATLTYKVMFGNDTPIAFKDDAGSVGGANDGTYSAVIPHQPAGNLIRFKISATANGTALSYPGAGDTRGYDGVVVRDTSVENGAQLPVLEWFLDDASYNQLARPVCDDVDYTGVITWQGKVFDNSTFRRRGHTSCVDPKPKIEMQLPAGYAIDFNGTVDPSFFAEPMSGLVDEFAAAERGLPDPRPGLGPHRRPDRPDGRLPARAGAAQRRLLRRRRHPRGVRRLVARSQGHERRRLLQGRGRRLPHVLLGGGARGVRRLRQEGPGRHRLHRRLAAHADAEPRPVGGEDGLDLGEHQRARDGRVHGHHGRDPALGLRRQELLRLPGRQQHRPLADPELGP